MYRRYKGKLGKPQTWHDGDNGMEELKEFYILVKIKFKRVVS